MNNSNQKKKPNKEIGHKRKLNVEDLKQQIKNKYLNRQKNIRELKVDAHRNIPLGQISVEIIRNEIRDSLLSYDYEADEIPAIINEIQEDMLSEEWYTQYGVNDNTVNVNRVVCNICERHFELKTDNVAVICENCAEMHFKENFDN